MAKHALTQFEYKGFSVKAWADEATHDKGMYLPNYSFSDGKTETRRGIASVKGHTEAESAGQDAAGMAKRNIDAL